MKILLFSNTDWYLYNFRLKLAKDLQAEGYDVILLSPPGKYATSLGAEGFRWLQIPLERRGMNPLTEMLTILKLVSVYRRERPDLIHHFTIKCVLYGSLAARICGVPAVVNSITGVGYLFTNTGWLIGLLQKLVKAWYRLVLKRTQVIFENEDNLGMFVDLGLVEAGQANLVRSAGVDVGRYLPAEEPEGIPVVMLASRMLWDNGIGEFVQAARILRERDVQAQFVLVGDTYADNPRAISREQLVGWQEQGAVAWWGWQEDMPAILQKANLVCLPSYSEGVPTVLLEAAATQRAVITTNAPGCRDAVIPGVSGLLVPVKEASALAEAIRKLVEDPALRSSMGRAGRSLVEREYSSKKVLEGTIRVYQKAGLKDFQA
jgi:glycosyltransferase involved in cell wall biosynthesis